MIMNGPANDAHFGGKRQSLICPTLNERMDMMNMNGPVNVSGIGGKWKH